MNTDTDVMERKRTEAIKSLKAMKGYHLLATDGEIGKIDDFYFDDETWTLRYFVVETGSWLSSRKVLVSPVAFKKADGESNMIETILSRDQIRNAPEADLSKPVSRQYEINLHEYFAWPMYWVTDPATAIRRAPGDRHLRSLDEVLGYTIEAEDGEFGQVDDILAEEGKWILRYLAIDTRKWLPGRKVLVAPRWIREVSWSRQSVKAGLEKDRIEKAPAWDAAQPLTRAYEEKLHDWYGQPNYWK